MKVIIIQDNGDVIETIEKVEEYDLRKMIARSDLMNDIMLAIERGKRSVTPVVQAQPTRPKPSRKPIKRITGTDKNRGLGGGWEKALEPGALTGRDENTICALCGEYVPESKRATAPKDDDAWFHQDCPVALSRKEKQVEYILEDHTPIVVQEDTSGELTLEKACAIVRDEAQSKKAKRFAEAILSHRSLDDYVQVKAILENIGQWKGDNAKRVRTFLRKFLKDYNRS